ncbi:MAG: 4-hydroxy-4-methyl-2-oxoglutarate aldolase [Gaiellaceae bacterium]|nr:4-hydroxy-4-methyl-2-oxoglutarate aldolase [Gaiellaceae bacterium]
MGAVRTSDLIGRLRQIEVSTLCDGDKTLPVVDPALRALVPDVRMAGIARTVVAEDDHLPVISALADARPCDVLVIVTNGGRRAILGELLATEAVRREVAGIVVDGYCRDVRGLRSLGLPVFARGTYPASGSAASRPPTGAQVRCGGVDVSPGDIVFGDDDGIVIAPPERVAAVLDAAESRARAEAAVLAGIRRGEALHDLTNYADHVAALQQGRDSKLEFLVDG